MQFTAGTEYILANIKKCVFYLVFVSNENLCKKILSAYKQFKWVRFVYMYFNLQNLTFSQ